jgi:membrane protein implicated in regulation of membrane protease activity
MFNVYLFATLVGWPFVLFFLFFAGDADSDFDVDADVDLDVDADVDVSGVGSVGAGVADAVLSIFSFRAMIFLFAFFGVTGLIMRGLGLNAVATFLVALAMGLFAGYLHARLYAYLKRSAPGTPTTIVELRGSQARVVVPVAEGGKGRVEVDVDGRPVYVTARGFRGGAYDKDELVVVVEIEDGTALIGHLNLDE